MVFTVFRGEIRKAVWCGQESCRAYLIEKLEKPWLLAASIVASVELPLQEDQQGTGPRR